MKSWNLVNVLVVSTSVLVIMVFCLSGYSEEAMRLNIRLTARLSGIFFSLAFVATAYQYFFKGFIGFWLISNRKNLGISFAIIHLLHLALLILLQMSFHPVFALAAISSLIGGGLAYVFAILMLMTSFDRFKRLISTTQWKYLHLIGGYWIWFIFIKSYYKRVTTEIEYLPLVMLFAFVFILRISKWILSKKQKKYPLIPN